MSVILDAQGSQSIEHAALMTAGGEGLWPQPRRSPGASRLWAAGVQTVPSLKSADRRRGAWRSP